MTNRVERIAAARAAAFDALAAATGDFSLCTLPRSITKVPSPHSVKRSEQCAPEGLVALAVGCESR